MYPLNSALDFIVNTQWTSKFRSIFLDSRLVLSCVYWCIRFFSVETKRFYVFFLDSIKNPSELCKRHFVHSRVVYRASSNFQYFTTFGLFLISIWLLYGPVSGPFYWLFYWKEFSFNCDFGNLYSIIFDTRSDTFIRGFANFSGNTEQHLQEYDSIQTCQSKSDKLAHFSVLFVCSLKQFGYESITDTTSFIWENLWILIHWLALARNSWNIRWRCLLSEYLNILILFFPRTSDENERKILVFCL